MLSAVNEVKMFRGNYNFFDYKYNIVGYHGQDFGSVAQIWYLVISIILMVTLLILLRKLAKENVLKIIRFVGVFLIIFYIVKTTWESIYDIKLTGSFNMGLLPLDACSIVMLAGVLSGFFKGKVKDYSDSWLVTGCIIGGIANMIFLNALKYYPLISFGASYSMIWHFLMVFIGLLMIVTNYVDLNFKTIIKGFIFHLCFSLIVIPFDFIYKYDFMMYRELGGIPFFEGIATKLTKLNLQFLNPVLMMLLYFVFFSVVILIAMGIKKLVRKGH
jgi:hypothetical protein